MKHIALYEDFSGSVLNEMTINRFDPKELDVENEIDPAFFASLMPKTAATVDEAERRVFSFYGSTMFVHYQYFDVRPNGNSPDRPTYRIHNSQYWLNDYQLMMQGRKGEKVNVTLLSITDISDRDKENHLGMVYVDTDVYLQEQKVVFETLNHKS